MANKKKGSDPPGTFKDDAVRKQENKKRDQK